MIALGGFRPRRRFFQRRVLFQRFVVDHDVTTFLKELHDAVVIEREFDVKVVVPKRDEGI
jgi:hypothetical protein